WFSNYFLILLFNGAGVEVKAGVPFLVNVDDEKVLHLSQACLGEAKKDKGNESVCLYVKTGDKKLVLGTLSADKFPQISFDLVLEKNFELSHNWKNGSVYFCGYKSVLPSEYPFYFLFLLLVTLAFSFYQNLFASSVGIMHLIWTLLCLLIEKEDQTKQAKPAVNNANDVKPDSDGGKQKVKIVEPSKDDDDDDDSDEDDEESEDVAGDDMNGEDDDDSDEEDDDDDESSEDEETPKKAEPSKKRPAESASKTPVSDKKAKLLTPQKNDGKKGGGHIATPYPAKQGHSNRWLLYNPIQRLNTVLESKPRVHSFLFLLDFVMEIPRACYIFDGSV
ncbi:Nucleoplasmin-like domain, partial [Dillenia turbinata]